MTDSYPDKWEDFNRDKARELEASAAELRGKFIRSVNEMIALALLEDVEARKNAIEGGNYDKYTKHHVASFELAQSGFTFRDTLSMALSAKLINDDPHLPDPNFATLQLIIPIDDTFTFSENLQPDQFPTSNELNVILTQPHPSGGVTRFYRVSPFGVQDYSPISDEDIEQEIELGMLMDTPEVLERLSEVHTDADFIFKLSVNLVKMHRYYQKVKTAIPTQTPNIRQN